MALWLCGLLADYRGVLGEGCVGLDPDRGVISSVSKDAPRGAGVEVRDYRGRGYIVAPGFIDLHVHLRGLELEYKESEETGCWAAASGGVTLVVDMPNTRPPLRSPEALDAKLESLRACVVDHGVYAGIPRDPRLVAELASRPIAGFKVYPEDLENTSALAEALRRGRLVVLHPEVPEAPRRDVAGVDLASRAAHRGCWFEAQAVLELSKLKGGRARRHVTHASCPSTVEAARGLGYTVDVTPHHLIYEARPGLDPCLYRVNPPIRSHWERFGLLKLVLEGRVDAFASDHAPHAPWEKSLPPACAPGIPWLGVWPWLLYRLVRAGALTIAEYHWLTSRGPALVLGLRGYGELRVGARANIVVYDPKASWRDPGPRHSRARHYTSVMEMLAGIPVEVVVGGVTLYREGEPLHGLRPGINPFQGPDAL